MEEDGSLDIKDFFRFNTDKWNDPASGKWWLKKITENSKENKKNKPKNQPTTKVKTNKTNPQSISERTNG